MSSLGFCHFCFLHPFWGFFRSYRCVHALINIWQPGSISPDNDLKFLQKLPGSSLGLENVLPTALSFSFDQRVKGAEGGPPVTSGGFILKGKYLIVSLRVERQFRERMRAWEHSGKG